MAHLDAAYVLGALDPDERRLFEGHLRSCTTCADSVRQLEGMPRLLSRVDESVFLGDEPPPEVPDTMLPALLRSVRGARRRRRLWGLGAAAATVAVVAGGVAVWVDAQEPDEPAAGATSVPMEQVGQDVVRASLAMEEVAWGTRLELTCSYDAPVDGYGATEPPAYTMAVQTRDGAWQQVATWRAVPGKDITVTAATAATAEEIASVEVRALSGRPVLELDS